LGQFSSLFGKCALTFFSRYSDPFFIKGIDTANLTGTRVHIIEAHAEKYIQIGKELKKIQDIL